MRKITNYTIVRNPDPIVFQNYINDNIKDGWEPFGSMVVLPLRKIVKVKNEGLPVITHDTMFHQAMVEYEK